ncbi:MAG: hypothetical protein ACOC93_06765 [Planctomycetota bacterium]
MPELLPYNASMTLSYHATLGLSPEATRIVIWSLVVLTVFVLGGAIVFYWLKRRLLSDDHEDRWRGFSVGSLEELRDRGQLTDEEFRRLRNSALGLDVGDQSGHNQRAPSDVPADESGCEGDRRPPSKAPSERKDSPTDRQRKKDS